MSIISGLSSSPIRRLQRTWKSCVGKTEETLKELDKLMDRKLNYSMYFTKIHSVSPPCLPWLGICNYVGSNLARATIVSDHFVSFGIS